MTSSRSSTFSRYSVSVSDFIQSCFHPNISGEEAEKILKSNGENGSFLLWLNNGYHHYVLSVMKNQHIIHLKIQSINGHYSMCDEEFESPYDVIQYCMENPDILKEKDGNNIELKQPVINTKKPTRWYHIYPKDAERMLNEKGKHGSYLVRSSYRHPAGHYVLCVRLKDEIVCVKIYANGEKFDIGAGEQFYSIDELILYYKEHPLKTDKGVDIHLDQGIDSDSDATGNTDLTSHDEVSPINTTYPVNIAVGYDPTSTAGILQSVEINGKHTLSLGGQCYNCSDTLFNEHAEVYRDSHGVETKTGIYYYECCRFPGYYIRWHNDTSVDCEFKTDDLDSSYFKWEKASVPTDDNDNNEKDQLKGYQWLVAHNSNPHFVSPAYLTFKELDGPPTIQTENPTKFLIRYQPGV